MDLRELAEDSVVTFCGFMEEEMDDVEEEGSGEVIEGEVGYGKENGLVRVLMAVIMVSKGPPKAPDMSLY